ncbi:MAG: two-component regulator propeller domain-containing protein [Candidatus Delongbacteria bacterium]
MFLKSIILLLVNFSVLSAVSTEFRTYCSVTKGSDVKNFDQTILFATDGGLVFYAPDGSIDVYDIDDGLYKPQILRVEKDFRGYLWAGHKDCSFTVFDHNMNNSVYLNHIENFGTYRLNNIHSSQKYVYIACDGLLSRYRYNNDFKKYEIADTNTMTGNVNDVTVFNGRIYIALGDRIKYISEDSQNINYLDNWTDVSGTESIRTNRFVRDQDTLYALTGSGLYRVQDGTATKETVFEDKDIYEGMFFEDKFYILADQVDASVIFSVNSNMTGPEEMLYGTYDKDPENFAFTVLNDKIYIGNDKGVYIYDDRSGQETFIEFDLPFGKSLVKGTISSDGQKFIYMNPAKFSYMNLDDGSFSSDVFTGAERNIGKNILESSDGSVYVASWSNGTNKFVWDGDRYVKTDNYSLSSHVDPTDSVYPYSVHPDVDEDGDGNIWITSFDHYEPAPDPILYRISPGGDIKEYKSDNYQSPYAIFIDDNNWIWLGSSSQQFGKLEGLAVGDLNAGTLKVNKIEINEGIISIAKDKDDIVWIGTNNGIKYIDLKLSPQNPLSISSANVNSVHSGPVSNFIYDIEVNGINEKWFATDNGVSVLSPDNTEWRHYVTKYYDEDEDVPGTIEKTCLIDRVVTDIEIDEENGTAVLVSENGLAFIEYGKIFKTQKLKDNEIRTKPSPFINDGSSVMAFYFPDNSINYDSARIFDMKGSLIRGGEGGKEFSINSGWDGRDNKGKLVSTGIYQIIAYDKKDPTIYITGKIAVVRK